MLVSEFQNSSKKKGGGHHFGWTPCSHPTSSNKIVAFKRQEESKTSCFVTVCFFLPYVVFLGLFSQKKKKCVCVCVFMCACLNFGKTVFTGMLGSLNLIC